MGRLKERHLELLQEVVMKQAPHRLELVSKARGSLLLDVERGELCDLISAEFVATGLGADDEPTARGVLLEELLDEVNRPRLRAEG